MLTLNGTVKPEKWVHGLCSSERKKHVSWHFMSAVDMQKSHNQIGLILPEITSFLSMEANCVCVIYG